MLSNVAGGAHLALAQGGEKFSWLIVFLAWGNEAAKNTDSENLTGSTRLKSRLSEVRQRAKG